MIHIRLNDWRCNVWQLSINSTIACVAVALLAVVVGCSTGEVPPSTPPPVPNPTNPPVVVGHAPVFEKELMINDLSVVNDARTAGPDGPWSFGGLMTKLAGASDKKTFVLNWLTTWEAAQTVNDQQVAPRSTMRSIVIDGWKARDGQTGASDATWNMNFANAPFRLLAIVNRIDLNRIDDPTDKTSGEGRFVFGVLSPSGDPLPFTVIFEYRLIGTDRERLRGWAQEWHALGTLSFGSQFNSALQVITDKFSGAGGQLNQIRSNEIALGNPWELREFRIIGGALIETPTLQTPANSFQNSATLTHFIDQKEAEILDGDIRVPERFENAPLLAASSQVPFNFFWQAPGVQNNVARHKLASITCNGCHHVETGTTSFLHVANRLPTEKAKLSGFLEGIKVKDPVNPAITNEFHDLKDRADILNAIATETGTIRLDALTQGRKARVH